MALLFPASQSPAPPQCLPGGLHELWAPHAGTVCIAQLTALLLLLSCLPLQGAVWGCWFADLPRVVLLMLEAAWFCLTLKRGSPFCCCWRRLLPHVHAFEAFPPSKTGRPEPDLICRSVCSPFSSCTHSGVFNLISLFTQTPQDERRMELTALIISTHFLSSVYQNCISIFLSLSILPRTSKGLCWCDGLGQDSGIPAFGIGSTSCPGSVMGPLPEEQGENGWKSRGGKQSSGFLYFCLAAGPGAWHRAYAGMQMPF